MTANERRDLAPASVAQPQANGPQPSQSGDQVTAAHAEPWASLAAAFDAEDALASRIKVACCEYLLSLNEGEKHPFILPTAIDWLGNGLTSAVLAALTEDDHG